MHSHHALPTEPAALTVNPHFNVALFTGFKYSVTITIAKVERALEEYLQVDHHPTLPPLSYYLF